MERGCGQHRGALLCRTCFPRWWLGHSVGIAGASRAEMVLTNQAWRRPCSAIERPSVSYSISFVFCWRGRRRTTVIGMLGAFGKMNLTSSNFPLRRQFSASPTLTASRIHVSSEYWGRILVEYEKGVECRAHQPPPLCDGVSLACFYNEGFYCILLRTCRPDHAP